MKGKEFEKLEQMKNDKEFFELFEDRVVQFIDENSNVNVNVYGVINRMKHDIVIVDYLVDNHGFTNFKSMMLGQCIEMYTRWFATVSAVVTLEDI